MKNDHEVTGSFVVHDRDNKAFLILTAPIKRRTKTEHQYRVGRS